MQINSSKLNRQNHGVDLWRNANGIGTLNWPTGFGKTFTGCNLVISRVLTKNPDAKIIVVVPSDQLRTDWRNSLVEYLGTDRQVLVETVHYFQEKRIKHECTLVIYDELHEYLSEDRRNLFGEWIDAKFRLGLTATYEDRHLRHELILEYLPVVDKITEEEALVNNWISQFYVYNLMLELDDAERKEYKKQSDIITEQLEKFNGDLKLAQNCLGGGFNYKGERKDALYFCRYVSAKNGYTYEISQEHTNPATHPKRKADIQAIADLWHPDKIKGYAGALLKATKRRKDILYNSPNKVRLAVEIISSLNKKFLLFSQSTDFAERVNGELLSKKIKSSVYHSKIMSIPLRKDSKGKPSLTGTKDFVRYQSGANKGKPKLFGKQTLLKLAVEELRDNKLLGLCTATALDKGFDDKTIELGIVASFTGSSTQMKQRKGRTTRLDPYSDGKPVIVVNMVFMNTAEVNWLREAQSHENHDRIFWISNIDEISTNPAESIRNEFNADFDI